MSDAGLVLEVDGHLGSPREHPVQTTSVGSWDLAGRLQVDIALRHRPVTKVGGGRVGGGGVICDSHHLDGKTNWALGQKNELGTCLLCHPCLVF